MSDERPNGQAESSPFPVQELGPNPYFPEEQSTENEEQAGSETETVAPEQTASEDGQLSPVGEEQFMDPGDIPEGMDTNDPIYKHFQAAFTKATQKRAEETKNLQGQLDDLKSQFQAGGKKPEEQVQEVVGPAPGAPGVIQVDYSGYQVPSLGEESPLSGYEADITKLIVAAQSHALNNIAQQQQGYMAQAQREQTITELEGFVNQVGAEHPGKQAEAIALLKEYAAFAQSDPAKFMTFAKGALELNTPATVQPQPTPTAQPQAQPSMNERQQAAVPRPTINGGAHPVAGQKGYAAFQSPDNTRAAIDKALAEQGL